MKRRRQVMVLLVTLIPFFYLLCSAIKTKEAFFSSHFLPLASGFPWIDWHGLFGCR